MVIVTKNHYLLASKIHHITLDENVNWIDVRNKHGRNISMKQCTYAITVIYAPEGVQTNNHQINANEQRECRIDIRHGVDAHKVFRDMVEQIREQMTDQLYLDKALEKMLGSVDLDTLGKRDTRDDDSMDAYLLSPPKAQRPQRASKNKKPTKLRLKKGKNDRGTKKVRRTGKAKRKH